MNTLWLLSENIINGYNNNILKIIAISAILSGIFVIISKNPIVSVLFLIGLFGNIAIYLNLIGLNFIGLSYIIVYIGAVSILFLFILMLINIRLSELEGNTMNSIPLAMIIILSLVYIIYQILPYNNLIITNQDNIIKNDYFYKNKLVFINNDNLLFATTTNWDNNIMDYNHISTIGSILYSSHNIWLIITSFILLLAMVGAIIITIKQK
jgi:NADH-ubiquinone oxidoreductase chain 6